MGPFNGNVFNYNDINFLRNSINRIIPHGSSLQKFINKGVQEEDSFRLLLIAAATISSYGLNDDYYKYISVRPEYANQEVAIYKHLSFLLDGTTIYNLSRGMGLSETEFIGWEGGMLGYFINEWFTPESVKRIILYNYGTFHPTMITRKDVIKIEDKLSELKPILKDYTKESYSDTKRLLEKLSFHGFNNKLYGVLEPFYFLEYGTVSDLLVKAYKSKITDDCIMLISLYYPIYKIKEALTII